MHNEAEVTQQPGVKPTGPRKSQEVGAFKNYLRRAWGNSKPLARLFRTSSRGYLYDTGTNKLLSCDEIVYGFLQRLFSGDIHQAIDEFISEYNGDMDYFFHAANTVKHVMETEKILLVTEARGFEKCVHFTDFEEKIASRLEMVTLEITDRCNFRCGYCIYNDLVPRTRSHGSGNMEPATAYKAIDYLNEHSSKTDPVFLGFYGGEPLLNFPVVKSSVAYAQSVIKDRKLKFTITTNGLLVTPEIARFFSRNKFNVVVSIDGPAEIHDLYRVDVNGSGTHQRVLRGLKALVDAYGPSAGSKLSLNIVYAPPFSEKKLDSIAAFFNELSWLPKDMITSISYPSVGTISPDRIPGGILTEDKGLRQWAFEKYRDKYTGKGPSHPLAEQIVEHPLALLMKRQVLRKPVDKYSLNGCCIPAVKKIFVSWEGKYHVCEKISTDAPTIGDVDSGIHRDTIKKLYIDQYEAFSRPDCSKCWAARLCTVCYMDVFNEGKFDLETKRRDCASTKQSKEFWLKSFCSLQEYNPKGLDYLADYNLDKGKKAEDLKPDDE